MMAWRKESLKPWRRIVARQYQPPESDAFADARRVILKLECGHVARRKVSREPKLRVRCRECWEEAVDVLRRKGKPK